MERSVVCLHHNPYWEWSQAIPLFFKFNYNFKKKSLSRVLGFKKASIYRLKTKIFRISSEMNSSLASFIPYFDIQRFICEQYFFIWSNWHHQYPNKKEAFYNLIYSFNIILKISLRSKYVALDLVFLAKNRIRNLEKI